MTLGEEEIRVARQEEGAIATLRIESALKTERRRGEHI